MTKRGATATAGTVQLAKEAVVVVAVRRRRRLLLLLLGKVLGRVELVEGTKTKKDL